MGGSPPKTLQIGRLMPQKRGAQMPGQGNFTGPLGEPPVASIPQALAAAELSASLLPTPGPLQGARAHLPG